MLRRIAILAVTMALICMPITTMAAPVVTEGEMLVMVDGGNAGVLQTLEDLGAPVYNRSTGRVLAGVTEAGMAALGGAATLLDRTPWINGTVYYWVTVHGSWDAPLPAAVELDVLYREGGTVLIKARPDEAEKLSMAGHSLAMVTRTHKVLAAPTKSTALSGTRAFGGEIDNMVAEINQLSYTNKLQALQNFGTRYTYASENDTAGDWIYNQFVSFGLSTERHWFSIDGFQKMNVVATLPGYVYPDEVVFICGHFDCISDVPYSAPGADDNGSGTAAAIEAARVLSGYTFERTIKFAAWSGEEQGMYGSGAYVADIAGAGMDVVAVYNFDMIAYSGSDPAPPDLVIYTNSNSLPVANLLRDAILYYVPTQVEPVIDTSALTASDHASFWDHGYQAILGIEDEAWGDDFNPYYHSNNDTVSHCDRTYATACTRAGVAAVAETAMPFSPTGMRVTPTGNASSEGANGGPFTPQQFDYILTNYESYALTYTVSESSSWLDASTAGGTLPALGTATVTLSINSAADSLADGGYAAGVDFVNTTNHDGDTTRTVELTVGVPVLQQQWTLDSNPGWTTQNQWAWGQPTGGGGQYGNPDPTSGHSGPNVYGYNLVGDYANNLSEAHLTSTAIDCSNLNTVILRFWRYLNVEQPTYDHAYVRASSDGANWTQIWTNTSEVTDSAWTQVEYDISAVADGQPTVYLRWTMGSTDTGSQYSGWNIDDVEIWGIDGSSQPVDTVGAGLDCQPGSGTLPLTTAMTVQLGNLSSETRRAAAHIDVLVASGTGYSNWRTGWTNLSPAEVYTTSWNQNLPALGALVGDNVFTLVVEDVTPAPFNQPPYPPAGDTDTVACTVTGVAP